MQFSLIPWVSAFVIVVLFLPPFIGFMHMKHEGQQIREEGPSWHAKKAGTPTMGGIVFILAIVMTTIWVLSWQHQLSPIVWMLLIALLGYGCIGFLDDGLKLFYKRNLGLRAWQKLLGQLVIVGIMIVLAISDHFDFKLWLPFIGKTNNLVWVTAFLVLWLVGFSNAANLTDGLDGLATGVSIIAYATYAYVAYRQKNVIVLVFAMSVIGALCGFFIFNHKPAKIFMGDAGSLALGGGLAAVALLLNRPWSLLLVGIIFVLETLSDILQVASFQLTGKRIFKMAPIHHHFEMLGWHEWKIDIVFWLVGLLGSVLYLVIWR